jgi:hypothetical protein
MSSRPAGRPEGAAARTDESQSTTPSDAFRVSLTATVCIGMAKYSSSVEDLVPDE